MISEMIAFALVFGFLKMSGHMDNVFEESKLSNYHIAGNFRKEKFSEIKL